MKKVNTVLIVEDEPKIAQVLVDFLEAENYRTQVLYDGLSVIETIEKTQPDMVILDVMLPHVDGLTLCREIRQSSDLPVLMLTARVDEVDRLMGLGFGADDYVCKPFSPREVVARVSNILRRVQMKAPSQVNTLNYKGVHIDIEKHLCQVNHQTLELTPVEFNIISALIEKPGRVLSREQLMEICYSDNRIVSNRTIDSHMKNLRQKIGQALNGEELIIAVYGVGYKI